MVASVQGYLQVLFCRTCMDYHHHHLVSHHRTMVVEAASQRLGGCRHDVSESGHDVGNPYTRAG